MIATNKEPKPNIIATHLNLLVTGKCLKKITSEQLKQSKGIININWRTVSLNTLSTVLNKYGINGK